MADDSSQADPFVVVSVQTGTGLSDAIREAGWIADGGDRTASQADQDLANLKRDEYGRERIRVQQRLLAFLAKQLSIHPPTAADLQQSKAMAEQLASMVDVNVKVAAIVNAATELLNIYNKT